MNYFELLRLAAPEAVLVVTALIVLALGLSTERASVLCSGVAAAGLLFASAAVLMLPPQAILFNGMLVITPLIALFKVICLALAFFTVIVARQSGARHQGEYLALLLLATVGLMLLVGSEELLVIFIGLELTGLSLYVMAAFDKTDIRSAEAGLKYFLFGSTASAFTLFGISLVYGATGATSLAAIAPKLGVITPILAAGLVMTLIGFAFKIAAAPFHLWAPDTYQGAPAASVAFIASASKVASFVVLGKIVLIGFGPAPLLAALAALSILIGNLVALAQSNVRRLLAYSAVAHAGYTLLGLVAGGREGYSATLFYTTTYAFTLVGAFGVIGLVRRETGGDDFAHFSGLHRRSPWLAGCMAVFMLSLAGLPPLAGFFGKFYLFSAALRVGGNQGLLWLVALALFGSLISFYYYLMVLKVIFVDETADNVPVFPSDFLQRASITLLAAIVLFLGVFPGGLVWKISSSLP
jgi:NADH-quinone oxidoreductase subunit N